MIKMKLPDNLANSGLALPESTPKTLIEISSESLPYACQCPLCGGLFDIPEGLLYKVEEDALLDGDFNTEMSDNDTDVDINSDDSGMSTESSSSSTQMSGTTSSATGVGETDDTTI